MRKVHFYDNGIIRLVFYWPINRKQALHITTFLLKNQNTYVDKFEHTKMISTKSDKLQFKVLAIHTMQQGTNVCIYMLVMYSEESITK